MTGEGIGEGFLMTEITENLLLADESLRILPCRQGRLFQRGCGIIIRRISFPASSVPAQ